MRIAPLAVTLALVAALAGCGGGGPDRSDVAGRLKKDPQFKGVPAKELDCVAEMMVKQVKKDDLSAYVKGRKRLEDLNGSEKGMTDQMARCMTG